MPDGVVGGTTSNQKIEKVPIMRTLAEFDTAFIKLNKELDSMSGKNFFAQFGIAINDLPPNRTTEE